MRLGCYGDQPLEQTSIKRCRDFEAACDVAHVDDDEGFTVCAVLLRLHNRAPSPAASRVNCGY
jgi:hypothetical protein